MTEPFATVPAHVRETCQAGVLRSGPADPPKWWTRLDMTQAVLEDAARAGYVLVRQAEYDRLLRADAALTDALHVGLKEPAHV